MNVINLVLFTFCIISISCRQNTPEGIETKMNVLATESPNPGTKNINGMTIESRFIPPSGYSRRSSAGNSFGDYLRSLPLKPDGAMVKYYDGTIKEKDVYDAVVDMEISKKDLQQCADAILRLRGEYFYSRGAFDKISFRLTNGFEMRYRDWMEGNRVIVNGNKTDWRLMAAPSNTYESFRKYLDFVFTYAGTLSLSKSLVPVNSENIDIGDVLIVGGSPGHAVIIVDAAESDNGDKVFLLAQSYMPAQEIQILKNPNDTKNSPWYKISHDASVVTPEWTFYKGQLKTWRE